jgi:hypothetical protein
MPGQTAPTTLFKAGCFDNDNINAINTNLTTMNSQTSGLVGTPINSSALAFGSYTTGGTAITLLATGHAAGTYRITVYGVITTTFVTSTAIQHNLGWTDDQGARTQTNAFGALTAGTNQILTTTVRSTGAAALVLNQVGTVANATAGVMALSAFVERLV